MLKALSANKIRFACAILLLTAAISSVLIFWAMTGFDASRPSSSSPYPAQPYPPPQAAPRTIPPLTPIGERVQVPGRLLILNRELGIPIDTLRLLSPQQVTRILEQNAERMGASGGKLVRQPDGREEWVYFGFAATTTPVVYCLAIQRGIAFLAAQYNPSTGLLRESPEVAPHKYWFTDNALAAYALSKVGERSLPQKLMASIRGYGIERLNNGLVQVIWGVPIQIPPHTEQLALVSKVGNDEVWQELRTPASARMDDWLEYSNLAFLGALNEFYNDRPESAHAIFRRALQQFDGVGFRDKAFLSATGHGYYETYKLALALYVGSAIRAPLQDFGPTLQKALLQKQATGTYAGGFHTLYSPLQPVGDPNTETTALALLALSAYGCR